MVYSFRRSSNEHAATHEGRMTMAQALPLDIPTTSELTEARDFLCEAAILVTDVKSLLSDSSHLAISARLKDIQVRLADEIWAVERMIAATAPGLYH
jgi:SepF-like predicted cell division protein (DUF552 family)